ncbi:RNA polymerase sigma-I factor [Caloramator sp. E03]|uniref:RNA polymerase sigma-I factor n=1 Tax=Caloramator sp. E03 TaxID=2576307 RepID=UPI0011100622|nr:RNA polymerase sigma-I factor [Caloramator sp. E03]QCX33212.1 RNA polymerase sigma-I factor [Caloramator sp. E03]
MDIISNKDEFIIENKPFIYKTASNICKRNLQWENDDELSIALIAFNKAIDTYDNEKGNFYSYAKMLIKNSLIDYFRNNSSKYTLYFIDEQIIDIQNKNSLNQFEIEIENKIRAQEIYEFSRKLKEFGIEFKDLIKSSPSHKDTRNELLNTAIKISMNEDIVNLMYKSKQLPIKKICLLTSKKEKFIESWRRYLISLIIILSDDSFKYIKSYLNIKAGD